MINRPSYLTWIVSTILVGLVLAVKYAGVAGMIPVAGPIVAQHMFEFLLGGYVLLWLGTIVKGM